MLLAMASLSPVYAGLRDNNLIEFGRGSYANMSVKAMLWPPFVKIYQDGRVIHGEGSEDDRYFVSRLDPKQLDSLKKRLAEEKYLWRSRFIDMPGDDINVHGGVSYIRYLDGDKEIVLATNVKQAWTMGAIDGRDLGVCSGRSRTSLLSGFNWSAGVGGHIRIR